MIRLGLAVGLLLSSLAVGQPTTYTVPIAARTPAANSVPGTAPIRETVVLPPIPEALDGTLAFATGGGTPAVFRVSDATSVSAGSLPATDAVATAPGVLVAGVRRTVVALSSGGVILLGTLESGSFVSRNDPTVTIPGTRLAAMTATVDGGAALFVSDGTNITRWDIDGSGTTFAVRQGFTISANPTSGGFVDTPNALVVTGLGGFAGRGVGYVGGGTNGDIYSFDAQLDAGNPAAFDVALLSLGRLSPPVTGLALMQGSASAYLLAANTQGLTVYDLKSANILLSAFILRGADGTGTITVPAGVSATNLSVPNYAGGLIAVGNAGDRTLAFLRWTDVADAGAAVVVDSQYDPRQGLVSDGGVPDAGDAGADGGPVDGGNGPGGGDHNIVSPGIPVDYGGCSAVGDGPLLFTMVAMVGLLLLRRRRRG